MRLNKFIASATGRSRREADELITVGRVRVDGEVARLGMQVNTSSDQAPGISLTRNRPQLRRGKSTFPRDDGRKVRVEGRDSLAPVEPLTETVTLDGQPLTLPLEPTLIMLNKPVSFVSSRRAQSQNAKTLYELLPPEFQKLKTVGRLDRDSSGLILLTDDGDLAFRMTHPKFAKTKIYEIELDKPLQPLHQQMIADFGVDLPDGKSQLILEDLKILKQIQDDSRSSWRVTMHEGRNRQIRRTFAALGYTVTKLHRTNFGNYRLGDLPSGQWIVLKKS